VVSNYVPLGFEAPPDVWVLANATGAAGTPTWLRLNPPAGPEGRFEHSVVYARRSNRLIVFGGGKRTVGSVYFRDTWVLTNANGLGGPPSWIRLPDRPSAQSQHSAVYDEASNRLIVFGGWASAAGEVWVLRDADGIGSPTWQQLSPSGTPPSARAGSAVAYDPASNRLMVFGGARRGGGSPFVLLDDLWVLTNANGSGGTPQWIQLVSAGPGEPLHSGNVIYDPTSNEALVFFAGIKPPVVNDEWQLATSARVWKVSNANGLGGSTVWNPVATVGGPPVPRVLFAAAYSSSTDRAIVSMGRLSPRTDIFGNDVWLFSEPRPGLFEGQTFSYDVNASDPDNPTERLTYAFDAAPAGMTINQTSGVVQWMPTAAHIGTHNVTVRISDQAGASARQSFPIIVHRLNQEPVVDASADVTLSQPGSTNLFGRAYDDGKPSNALTLAWTKVSGAGNVTFASPNARQTGATFDAVGTYVLRFTASDGQLSAGDQVTVTVTGGVNLPPAITIAPTWNGSLPGCLTVTYTVTDDGLPLGGAPTVSWTKVSGPGNVGFQGRTPTSVSVCFDQPGTYILRITATDTQFTVSKDITVTVNAAIPPPAVTITSPTEGAEVTTRTTVTGSVGSSSLQSWTLEFRMAGETGYRTVASGTTTVTNAALGTFDPTILLNGIAYIRLRATDTAGGTATTEDIGLVLTKNQKIGHFTVSFNDLTVPMPGMPIQIVRTYDSRNRAPGDFGYGWTLDIKTVRLHENIVLGTHWQGTVSGPFIPQYCVQPAKAHVVAVTLPDNTTYRFQPTVSPQCQAAPIAQVAIGFAALPGTNATLAIEGNNLALTTGNFPGTFDLFDDSASPIDPNRYRLTLPDGRVLIIDQATGLESMTDANGNRLTITSAGIQHTSGKSVVFTRQGAAQNITRITDPAGNSINYNINLVTGDLDAVTDREGRTTTFTYDSAHGLLGIRDPRGIQPIRNEYDASGRLIRHIDAFGNAINYTHSTGTNQEIVTDRLGNVTVNEYDADGNVVKVTDALGGVTARTYDARGNMLTETNALGKTRTFTYDAQDNRLTETDPLGNTTTYTYNSLRQVLTITDALGRVTVNTYDARGNLIATKDAAGQTTSYAYDARGLQTAMTDPLGNVTRYDYDAAGNQNRMTDALGGITTYTHDASGNKLTETRTRTTPTGSETLVTSYQYDRENRLVKTTYPDGSTTQVAYNSIGKQSATADQLGRATSYTYDAMGRLTRTDFPDGTNEQSAYDAEGRRVSSTDRAGRLTSYTYDKLGRLTKTTYADTTSTGSLFDAIGQVTQAMDARGNLTRYAYDDAGRRTLVTDALGQVTSFAYDRAGNQVSLTDARGNTTQYQYDPLNRRTRIVHPDGTFEATAYDALGRVISKTDQAGRVTQYGYDALGRLVQVTDALGQVTRYGYDQPGNRTSQTDALGRITRFEHDKLGRRTKRTLPLGMAETSTYDPAGNLLEKIDFNGRRTTYQYDTANRLIRKTPDPFFAATPVTFVYNPAGQRTQMTDASGTTTYLYDSRDRLISKATPQGTLAYGYDAAGNLTSIRSSNVGGTSADYTYDVLNRLAAVKDNRLSAGTTSYAYDNAGNLQSYLYPNGVRHTYAYNTLNRLTSLTIANSAATVASYGYTLGPSGNRTRVVELGGRAVGYTYDALYRLTQEAITGDADPAKNGSVGYVYDAVGNRLQRSSTIAVIPAQAFTYDANDRLNTETYDNNGNTVGSGGDAFAYEFENRLKMKNGTQVAIVYDGDGNRVAKTVGGVTTRYLVDDRNLTGYAQVLEEVAGGTVALVYTYGLNRISQSQASGTSFYGYDGHGNVRVLTDTTGAVTDRYDYDAFGNIISQVGTTPNVYLYSGEQNDASLGLYYLRSRYLKADLGRMVTMDDFEGLVFDPVSRHSYLYARANPVDYVDPSGHFAISFPVGAVVALFSTVVPSYQPLVPPDFLARTRALEATLKLFRAAVQIQGADIPGTTISRSWAEPNPWPASMATDALDELYSGLTPMQRQRRDEAIISAKSYIARCSATGGCDPPGQSGFQNPPNRRGNPRVPDARIDVPIFKGRNLI
jgi:RHS repeat-associated protein